jgi:hypothetical protein
MNRRANAEAQAALPPCPESELAASYVRNELPATERAAFDAHCLQCPACRSLLAGFRDVAAVFEAAPAPALDADFPDRVLASLHGSKATPEASRKPLGWHPILKIAAGLLVAVGAGTVALRMGKPAETAAASQAKAVTGALDWLARSQESSGAWDPAKWQGEKDYQVGLSGLALLTLVTQSDSALHTNAIRQAIRYLVQQQSASGAFGPECNGRMYNHGIATTALAEAYRKGHDPMLRDALAAAYRYIADQQLAVGGWGYTSQKDAQANSSISVWQLSALRLAGKCGFANTATACHRGMRWLYGMVDGNGFFGYQSQGDRTANNDTLTAMGAACLFTDRPASDAESQREYKVRKALLAIAARPGSEPDFYRNFFLARAFQTEKKAEYQEPLKKLQNSIVAMRTSDGSLAGAWEPVGTWSSVGGRIYATTMAAMCLEARSGIN